MNLVTLSGWYENDDGTVTYHQWRDGRLVSGPTCDDWAGVVAWERREEEAERERERAQLAGDRDPLPRYRA